MFSPWMIATSFIAMFASVLPLQYAIKNNRHLLAKLTILIGLFLSIYCISAGAMLLQGWHDPFAMANPDQVRHAATSHGGRGGIIIFAIRYWPYLLIGIGGYFGFSYLSMFLSYIPIFRKLLSRTSQRG